MRSLTKALVLGAALIFAVPVSMRAQNSGTSNGNGSAKPEITAAVLSADQAFVFVQGNHLGSHPVVSIGTLPLQGVVVDTLGVQLVAQLPALAPGTYLLNLTTGRWTTSFVVAVGVAGPPGPPGKQGQQDRRDQPANQEPRDRQDRQDQPAHQEPRDRPAHQEPRDRQDRPAHQELRAPQDRPDQPAHQEPRALQDRPDQPVHREPRAPQDRPAQPDRPDLLALPGRCLCTLRAGSSRRPTAASRRSRDRGMESLAYRWPELI